MARFVFVLLLVLALAAPAAPAALAAPRETVLRPVKLAKNDPAAKLVADVNLMWGESNIMNDNGVLLYAREFEGEHGENPGKAAKESVVSANEDMLADSFADREDHKFPRDAKIESKVARYSERAVQSALRLIGVEGFGYNPHAISKLLRAPLRDGEANSSTIESFEAIMSKLGINEQTGAIVRSRVAIAEKDSDSSRHFTMFLFLNRETNRLLWVFVRESNY